MKTRGPTGSQSRTGEQEEEFGEFFDNVRKHALNELGLDKGAMQRLQGRKGELHRYIMDGIRRFSAITSQYALVRTILGQDFISPMDIAKARGIAYTREQLSEFWDTLPPREVLEWCHEHNYVLLAGPPRSMSLLEIRELRPGYFYSKLGGWCAGQKFALDERQTPRWIMLRKELVPGSTSKTWDEQQVLLSGVEVIPNVAEVVWIITTYKAVRDIFLLTNTYVRTSSIDSNGSRVLVGHFDTEGQIILDYRDDHRDDIIGVSSSRK